MNNNPQQTDATTRNDAPIVEPKPMRTRPAESVAVAFADPRVSVVVPCLNEEATIAGVVNEIFAWSESAHEHVEVIVADNGSTDNSVSLAKQAGATIVTVETKGYGSAIRGGMQHALGDVIVIGDADGQHDFSEIGSLLARIDDGCDMVIGSRFDDKGQTTKSLPWLNRTIGAPVLSAVGRLISGTDVRDFHCGYRAITRQALDRVTFECTGMEFASEMIVKAAKADLVIGQCPVSIRPAGRDRPPHLRPFRDGMRHLAWMIRNR